MNMKSRGVLLGLLIVVQLGLPALHVWKGERTLLHGKAFRFAVEPVDPQDAFRGRYVSLRLQSFMLPLPPGIRFAVDQEIHVRVASGPDGLAILSDPQVEAFTSGDYLSARTGYAGKDGTVDIELPFDRYYLDETLGPEADAAYRKLVPRRLPGADGIEAVDEAAANRVQLGIRVLDGYAVIEDLYYDGKPVRQFLTEAR